jgi:hypothetical protein
VREGPTRCRDFILQKIDRPISIVTYHSYTELDKKRRCCETPTPAQGHVQPRRWDEKCVCTDPQALARQFKDDEAVWRDFESRRLIRRFLGKPYSISDEYLDQTDWLEAERIRPVRAIGMPLHQP